MKRSSVACVSLITLACAALSTAGSAATRPHGLYGTLVLDPSKPVCEIDKPCSRPLVGWRLAFSRPRGVVVSTVRTRAGGRYRISLRPGTYLVSIAPARKAIGRGLEPRQVSVRRYTWARVNFTYDAGIR